MNGRIVIPIHNDRGELIAYAGRSIDGAEPKYKLPPGFKKSEALFNLHRVLQKEKGTDLVIVVEGFFDVMTVCQASFADVVALMGSSISEAQETLLSQFKHVVFFLDGDQAPISQYPFCADECNTVEFALAAD